MCGHQEEEEEEEEDSSTGVQLISVYADGLESSESESSESGHMSLFTVIFVFGWCPSLG